MAKSKTNDADNPSSSKTDSTDVGWNESVHRDMAGGSAAAVTDGDRLPGMNPEEDPASAFDIRDPEDEESRDDTHGGEGEADSAAKDAGDDDDTAGKTTEEEEKATPSNGSGVFLSSNLVDEAKRRGFTDADLSVFTSDAQLAVVLLRNASASGSGDETLAAGDNGGEQKKKWEIPAEEKEKFDPDFARVLEDGINQILTRVETHEQQAGEAQQREAAAHFEGWINAEIEKLGDEGKALFGATADERPPGSEKYKNFMALLTEMHVAGETLERTTGKRPANGELLERALVFRFNKTETLKRQTRKEIADKLKQRGSTQASTPTSRKYNDAPKGREKALKNPKFDEYGIPNDVDAETDEALEAFLP